jgi:hypothetical protein
VDQVHSFEPRGAAIDYWFWKFHVDDLALLVDVIIRRPARTAEVRVSLWLGGIGRVIHSVSQDWSATPDEISAGTTQLRPGACTGDAEDVSWDLRWDDGATMVNPLVGPLARFEPFDTTVLTWPLARFDGWVRVGDRQFDVRDVPGAFYHYWGRSLSSQWVWISATSFEDDPGRRLEGIVQIRTRLLGGPPYPVTLGYLWSTDGDRADLTVSTVNGLIRARPVAEGIAIDTIRLGGPRHRLVANWGSALPNDIGEGIVQTMHADLVLDGHRAVPGTVGLETRGWPSVAAVAAMPANGREAVPGRSS